MAEDVLSIEKNTPHITREVICVKCCHRHVTVAPLKTWLKNYECPGCGKQGYVIDTGQDVEI